jgi:RNA polymerase-binding transcription factor DksA
MNRHELKAYKERLLALRARLRGDLLQMSESVLTAGSRLRRMPIHAADISGHHFDQDMAVRLLAAKEQTLQRIERALEAIEDGTYGVCSACGRTITKLRLSAVPYATECMRCACGKLPEVGFRRRMAWLPGER